MELAFMLQCRRCCCCLSCHYSQRTHNLHLELLQKKALSDLPKCRSGQLFLIYNHTRSKRNYFFRLANRCFAKKCLQKMAAVQVFLDLMVKRRLRGSSHGIRDLRTFAFEMDIPKLNLRQRADLMKENLVVFNSAIQSQQQNAWDNNIGVEPV